MYLGRSAQGFGYPPATSHPAAGPPVVPVFVGAGSVVVEGSPAAVVVSAGALVVDDAGAADFPAPVQPAARSSTPAATTLRTAGSVGAPDTSPRPGAVARPGIVRFRRSFRTPVRPKRTPVGGVGSVR
jgi:hypothetical protein